MKNRKRSTKPKAWSESEKRRLVQLARGGATASQISAELGRYIGSVKRVAREMGLLLKKQQAQSLSIH